MNASERNILVMLGLFGLILLVSFALWFLDGMKRIRAWWAARPWRAERIPSVRVVRWPDSTPPVVVKHCPQGEPDCECSFYRCHVAGTTPERPFLWTRKHGGKPPPPLPVPGSGTPTRR